MGWTGLQHVAIGDARVMSDRSCGEEFAIVSARMLELSCFRKLMMAKDC